MLSINIKTTSVQVPEWDHPHRVHPTDSLAVRRLLLAGHARPRCHRGPKSGPGASSWNKPGALPGPSILRANPAWKSRETRDKRRRLQGFSHPRCRLVPGRRPPRYRRSRLSATGAGPRLPASSATTAADDLIALPEENERHTESHLLRDGILG